MKKEQFYETRKKGMGRKSAVQMAVIAVLILAMAVTTGCGNETDKGNTSIEASQSVTQETTPSTSEMLESTADVVESTESATVDAVESTEETSVENIEEIINNIDFSKYTNAPECINDLKQYDTLMVIVCDADAHGGKAILVDGDSYIYKESDRFVINRSPEDNEVKWAYIKADEGNIYATSTSKSYSIPFATYFSDGLYTIVVEYNDGSQQELTIDLTFEQ